MSNIPALVSRTPSVSHLTGSEGKNDLAVPFLSSADPDSAYQLGDHRGQYDELIKLATALRLGTADAESVLRRFTRNNVQHPTNKALCELGKAVKTVFLCDYLLLESLRREIYESLQVIETPNFGKVARGGCATCYKRQTLLQFRVNVPYGLTCRHLSGDSARRSTPVRRFCHSGSPSTC